MARRRTRYQRGPAGYGLLPKPPPGTYDPSIDSSERAAQRGYRDLRADTITQGARAASDYGIGLEDIGRQRDYGLADLLRQGTRADEDFNIQGAQIEQDYGRNLADLLKSRARGTEDYNTNIANLRRNYMQLGGRQAQAASAMGTGEGGALMQALQKRQANEAIDRQPIDTGYNRFLSDSNLAESRLGENRASDISALDLAHRRGIEDIGTSRERLTAQYGTGQSTYKMGMNPWVDAWIRNNPGKPLPPGVGPVDSGYAGQRLSLGYQRGGEDRATVLRRAGRELNAYRTDLIPTRFMQATGSPQMGVWRPPRRRR